MGTRGGAVRCSWLVLAAGPQPAGELWLTGNLAPGGGRWQAQVIGGTGAAVLLAPGTDGNQTLIWRLPLAGVALPGALTVQFSYQPGTERAPASPDAGVLYLDAGRVQ